MPNYCAAFGCTNSSTKESCRMKSISFHKFPLTDKILLRRWLVNIRRANFQPTPYSYICSDHFTEEEFEYQPFTKRRGLKKGAIPTRFSFSSHKNRSRRKADTSNKNQSLEKCRRDYLSKPASTGSDMEYNEVQVDNPALLDVFMNEKFYPPDQIEALCLANGVTNSSESKHKSCHTPDERIVALKEILHAKILLRSLKKQFLDAEIKAAYAKRDYYETKKAMLSDIQDVPDSESCLDSQLDSTIQKIKTRLEEEELAAEIEERMLQEQLQEIQMHADNCKKEYYEAKKSLLTFS